MTLVVSEISHLGIVMVGDSAVTELSEQGKTYSQAVKVQYSERAKIGISMWGWAPKPSTNIKADRWLSDFLQTKVSNESDIEDVAWDLIVEADRLFEGSEFAHSNWGRLARGFHIAGYSQGQPRLWHIHCGHSHEHPHSLILYKDFPENYAIAYRLSVNLGPSSDSTSAVDQFATFEFKRGLPLTDLTDNPFSSKPHNDYIKMLNAGHYFHLRNGEYRTFSKIYDKKIRQIRRAGAIQYEESLDDRLLFYKELVVSVSNILRRQGMPPRVNDRLSAFAFNEDGLQIDERLQVPI
ncbi:MAG: hypothetical protein IT350_02320 [Deltaproteobacteria bacterium]|nr:hypothetical protein [Deltaproteobacteria bacterium]